MKLRLLYRKTLGEKGERCVHAPFRLPHRWTLEYGIS